MGIERVEQIQQKQTKKGDAYLRVKLSRSGWASAFDTNVITTLQEGRDYDVELGQSGKYVHVKQAKEVPTGAPAPAGLPDARAREIRRQTCAKIAGWLMASAISAGKVTPSLDELPGLVVDVADRLEARLFNAEKVDGS